MSQIIRIGPQNAKQSIFLHLDDVLEVVLPEKRIAGIWHADYDTGLLWGGEEGRQKACWVLSGNIPQTVRTFQALSQGSCVLYFEYINLEDEKQDVLETIFFEIYIDTTQAPPKYEPHTRPAIPTWSTTSGPVSEEEEYFAPGNGEHAARLRKLEEENRTLQERLWNLTNKLVELTEGYAAIIKKKRPRKEQP